VLSLDGAPVAHWVHFEGALRAAPDRPARVVWQRGRAGGGIDTFAADLTPERRGFVDEYGQQQETVVLGAHGGPRLGAGKTVPIEGRLTWAAGHAIARTGETIALMARGFAGLLAGRLPSDSVGGPLMVYRMASVSGAKGWDDFLLMFALISINLGLINLLPVPMLDGGHVLVFAVEAARRRRLSARAREGVVLAGLVLIVSLTVLALRNDIVRYLLR
jgi:regulator of sigma E protease